MTKESNNNELKQYTSKESKLKELYGNVMQATSLSTETKNLQHLTNDLIDAAKADLKKDRENPAFKRRATGIRKLSRDNVLKSGSTDNFDIFMERLAQKIATETGKSIEEVTKSLNDIKIPRHKKYNDIHNPFGETIGNTKDVPLRDYLKLEYKALKYELDKTRILGANKSNSEKVLTLATNTARIILKPISFALSFFALGDGRIMGDVSTLGNIRGSLKDVLSKGLNKYGLKEDGTYSQTSPILTNNKLWKKESGPVR